MARKTHSLGRDGLGLMISLVVDGPVIVLARQGGARTPAQSIQLTAQQLRDAVSVIGAA